MLRYWVWLSQAAGIGAAGCARLLEHFDTPEAVYRADAQTLRAAGLSEREVESLSDKDLSLAEAILDVCYEKDIRLLTLQDSAYPEYLKEISDPPPVLYYYGRLPDLSRRAVLGVVGARKASAYGLTSAKRLGYQIARCGGVVVTGLARGIDTQAAQGALTAGGTVIGVLGCGVDVVYPPENRYLYRDVVQNGCILSEFPPQTPPFAGNFPQRNRIISGISDGVIVVEAGEKSGALITAELALEQGRDVFAVPGTIDNPACAGSNQLLRASATLITCGWDAMQEYLIRYPDSIVEFHGGNTAVAQQAQVASPVQIPESAPNKKTPELTALKGSVSEEEYTLLQCLEKGELQLDELIANSGLPPARVLTALTMLQVKGHLRQLPGKRFTLAE